MPLCSAEKHSSHRIVNSIIDMPFNGPRGNPQRSSVRFTCWRTGASISAFETD